MQYLSVHYEQPLRKDAHFWSSHPSNRRKMPNSTNYGYGWYSEEQLDDYYDKLIGKNLEIFKAFFIILQFFPSGEHAETLKKQCFTDAKKTNCLEAIKFVANLVWNSEANFVFHKISIVNTLLLRVPGEAGPQPPRPVERLGQRGRPQHHPPQLPPCQQDQGAGPVRLHQGGACRVAGAAGLDPHGRHQGLRRLWPQVGLFN